MTKGKILSTIYITPRLATAQDLLHQCMSLTQQMRNFVGFIAPAMHWEDALNRVIADEVESQTQKMGPFERGDIL